jgi:hypothetical protein
MLKILPENHINFGYREIINLKFKSKGILNKSRSAISISSSNIIKPKGNKIIKKGNTCPVARRPVDDICRKEGYVIKINKMGYL